MPHMVIFRDVEGRPGYHQAEALEDAVRFVEHLRNEQEVSETRIFSMQEVPIEFKSYWRVEVASPAADPQPVGPEEAEGEVEPVDREVDDDDDVVNEPVGRRVGVGAGGESGAPVSNGRFGLFGRS